VPPIGGNLGCRLDARVLGKKYSRIPRRHHEVDPAHAAAWRWRSVLSLREGVQGPQKEYCAPECSRGFKKFTGGPFPPSLSKKPGHSS